MLFANVRTPAINRGDLRAQLASAELGKRRFLELLERYGPEVVHETAHKWMDYSEGRLRDAISAIPDGDYEAEATWRQRPRSRDTRANQGDRQGSWRRADARSRRNARRVAKRLQRAL